MIEKPRQRRKRPARRISRKGEIIKAVVLVALIAIGLRTLVIYPFEVKDNAMESSLYAGDFVLASKLAYRIGMPRAGDLAVFEHPFRPDEELVRRVIATEGQSVEIVGKMVYVDGELIEDDPRVKHSDYRILPKEFSNRDYLAPQQVPPGHLFVLGDNRDRSEDSRDFGFVDVNSVHGKAMFVYFSWAPDPNAPRMGPPYIIPALHVLVYNLLHFPERVRWNRFFAAS